ncbi:YwpF-like family protein [Bacillus massilinigeriensis]|uniref:YwpF-like family protein n=1 Tax=Bacillus massilionigeriensis TaxID=1805475 RepID=UPI00096B229C|nr:YwpF-like family protein [Bacillus massilionigeriensis]
MKTFKLVSLQIEEESGLRDIPLDDGLIINKEDESNTWLIEAYIPKSQNDYFQDILNQGKMLNIQVIITKKDNFPAPFTAKIHYVKVLDQHISVLLKGNLRRMRSEYAELLLQNLMEKGLQGDDLLTEFKEQMQLKPKVSPLK